MSKMCRRHGSSIDWKRLVTRAATYTMGKTLERVVFSESRLNSRLTCLRPAPRQCASVRL
jgi:hypothetical protein